MIGKVQIVGPHSPGQGQKLLKSGAITGGFMWNPKEAGKVFVNVGKMMLDGSFKDGADVAGLGAIKIDGDKNVITVNLVPINKDTVDNLAGMGL
jgi:simple sugar transport system substrate-binding protein